MKPRRAHHFAARGTSGIAGCALLTAALLAAAVPARAMTSSLPPAADGLIRTGLDDLHDGLYGKAEASFRAAGRAAPGDPAPPLFIAFSYWWRTLQDRSDRSLDGPFLEAIEQVVQAGDRLLETAPDDRRVLTCVGTAHILRSQVEGNRRNFFKASQEARRGKKNLDAALRIDASNPDVLFGLGAYNYFTEKIPGLARGLLFMPKGDADLGLRQLKDLASSDAYFSTDARLLLAIICGSRDEQCYGDALAHLTRALEKHPKSPLMLGSIGGLKIRLGYYGEAIQALHQALAGMAGDDAERVDQRRILKVYLAEALSADWRLDRAAVTLREVGDPSTLPARERHTFERIVLEISQKQGLRQSDADPVAAAKTRSDSALAARVGAALAAQDDGRDGEASTLLATAAEAYPQDPLPRFLLGRLRFEQGQFAAADRELSLALERASDPPAWMAGWIELYRGLAQNALGHREAAEKHFRTASEVKKFRSAERGLLELRRGAPSQARCRP
ncbi:MAG TPA: hypothetical protein VKF61_05780 [Candidatus Polarisedimenticolia bacterium]|nr:hypothetical protein [Candidatus Polarisedimenticolia bacterium]